MMNMTKRNPKKLISKILSIAFAGVVLCAGVFPFLPMQEDKASAEGLLDNNIYDFSTSKVCFAGAGNENFHFIGNRGVSGSLSQFIYGLDISFNQSNFLSRLMYGNSIINNYTLEFMGENQVSYLVSASSSLRLDTSNVPEYYNYSVYDTYLFLNNGISPNSSSLSDFAQFTCYFDLNDLEMTSYVINPSGGGAYLICEEEYTFLGSDGSIYTNFNCYNPVTMQNYYLYSAFSTLDYSSLKPFNFNGRSYLYLQSYTFRVFPLYLGQTYQRGDFSWSGNLESSDSLKSLGFYNIFGVSPLLSGSTYISDCDEIINHYLYWRNEYASGSMISDAIFSTAQNFFNLEVFPNFRISYFLMIGVGALIFGFVLKVFMGG